MAKNKAFNTKQSNFNEYMAQLDELLRKNRGSALYKGYDVNPNAMLMPGKVSDPTGLGNQQYQEDLRYEKYAPQSTAFEAPNVGQIAPYQEPRGDYSLQANNQTQQNVSATDFFNQVAQAIYSPKLPSQQSSEELEQIYQQTGQKYAVQSLPGGEVRYNDGSIGIDQPQQPASPIASMSDGNVLWSDGWVRPQLPDYMQGSGVEALSQGLFGRQQYVTQPYGRYNPIEPTPGNINLGTDFRTRDLQTKEIRNLFSEPLEVVEIYNQAQPGSGFVGSRENRGYGNSILLRRQDGSMIRVSHFNNLGQFDVGDMIQPGQVIGTPGSTGNVTGEHADVELYSAEGQIVSPDSFMASIRESSPSQERLYKPYELQMSVDPQQPQPQTQPQEQPRMIADRIQEARDYAKQFAPQQMAQAVQPGSPQREALGQIPEKAAQTVGIQGEGGIGEAIKYGKGEEGQRSPAEQARVSALGRQPEPQAGRRGLWGDVRQLAGNTMERIGDVGNLFFPGSKLFKEGARSEAIAGGATKHTGQAMASEIGARPKEQIPGIRQNLSDIGKDISEIKPFRRVGEVVQNVGQKAGEAIQTGTDNLISKTKDAFGRLQAPGVIQKPSTLDIDPNAKQVGETSGQQNMSVAPIMSKDTRDPFFKYGGSQDFAGQLKDNASELYGGALDLGVFKPKFYENPKAVGTVFGDTAMAGGATEKYKDYLKSNIKKGFDQPYREEVKGDYKYKIPVKEYWENKYWQDKLGQTPDKLTGDFSYQDFETPDVKRQAFKGERQSIAGDAPTFKSNAASLFVQAGDRAGKFVRGIGNKLASIYKPHPFSRTVAMPDKVRSEVQNQSREPEINIPEVTRTRYKRPTLSDYLSRGKTAAQFYAETGQQSTLDAIRGNPRLKFNETTGGVEKAEALRAPSISQARNQGSRTGTGPRSVTLSSGRVVTAGPGQHIRVDSSGNVQQVDDMSFSIGGTQSNLSTPVKTPSAQLTHQARTSSHFNPFRSIYNKVKRWF